MADSFVIEGLAGKKLFTGTIPVRGAKNNILKLMAAATLIEGKSCFTNVPAISDVDSVGRILEGMGAFVSRDSRDSDTLSVSAKNFSGTVLNPELAKSIRASVVLLGPTLARLGAVSFPHPGGDVIGERPIDLFLLGFQKLGARLREGEEGYTLTAPGGLSGGEIFFRIISVTATETFMMAATLAKGPVTLKNCALEPEVVALAGFLRSCGAKIEGAGTATISIEPSVLSAPEEPFRVIPDRIEAATFLALGALAGEKLTVSGVEPTHLDAVLDMLSALGVPLSISENAITVSAPGSLRPVKLRTHEYPGFPTDAQAPFTVLLTQAEGESAVYETIFDGRLAYTADLIKMGAIVELPNPHRANVKGKTPLKAADITSPDIRAGLAFILAAAVADGTSRVENAHLIDRGYERIEERLSKIGLSIKRT